MCSAFALKLLAACRRASRLVAIRTVATTSSSTFARSASKSFAIYKAKTDVINVI